MYHIFYNPIKLFTETIAALQAFRKRHGEAQRQSTQYASQPVDVDISHYRSILKNIAIVDEAEKILREFKPVTYDVNAHVKAIETFEAKAVCDQLLSHVYSFYRSPKPKRLPKRLTLSSRISVQLLRTLRAHVPLTSLPYVSGQFRSVLTAL